MDTKVRVDAIQRAQEYLAQKPVYLDTETTGIGPHSEIVEICVVDHDGGILLDTLVKPWGKVDPGAQNVHGISQSMLVKAVGWQEIWPQVEAALRGRIVGIFNQDFDVRMLQQSHRRNGMQWRQPAETTFFCVMKLYARFYGQWNSKRRSYRWQSLDNARWQCGLETPNSHRAKNDTLLTRQVLHHMANSSR